MKSPWYCLRHGEEGQGEGDPSGSRKEDDCWTKTRHAFLRRTTVCTTFFSCFYRCANDAQTYASFLANAIQCPQYLCIQPRPQDWVLLAFFGSCFKTPGQDRHVFHLSSVLLTTDVHTGFELFLYCQKKDKVCVA